MNIDELVREYEEIMGITLTEREKLIFTYAYSIGKGNLDKSE